MEAVTSLKPVTTITLPLFLCLLSKQIDNKINTQIYTFYCAVYPWGCSHSGNTITIMT